MGRGECVITLDNQWNTYYPGQTVNGKAEFNFDKPKKIRGISIKFKGVAEVKWQENISGRDERGESRTVSVDHTAQEEYFSITYYLLGSKSGGEIELPQGNHTYPFTCALPPTLPSSFEGEYGFVRYTVKVTLDRPWKFDQETKMAFTVTSHLDLNLKPENRNPIHIQLEKTFCCCWCKTGPLSLDIRLPVRGYCCGQTIPLDINCENNSGVQLNEITIQLKKFVTYRCTTPISQTKEVDICISELKLGIVEGNITKNYQKLLEIPPLPPSDLVNCSIIDLEYKIIVLCNVSGLHFDMSDERMITIGTVPLIGFQPPPPDGQSNIMMPSVPTPSNNAVTPETPLISNQTHKPDEMNITYSVQQLSPITSGGNMPYPYPPQINPYPPQTNLYPPPMTGISSQDNVCPSAPIMDNAPYSAYPGMGQPMFKESQFSASNIHDSADNQYTKISGNETFAPRYPTYGFVIP